VPRQNPIPQREIEICGRLRLARKATNLSQVAFARLLEIDSSRLASYELARVPVKWELAFKLCKSINLSQRWLALGVLPMHPTYEVGLPYSPSTKANSLFSSIFDDFLNVQTRVIEQAWVKEFGEEKFRAGEFEGLELTHFQRLDRAFTTAAVRSIVKAITIELNWLPDDLRAIYINYLADAMNAFRLKHSKQIGNLVPPTARELSEQAVNLNKISLRGVTESGKHSGVQAKLKELRVRLNQATADRGMKSRLAKFMRVPLPNVSQWLSGKREPGGETTLKLLQWVEQQERQK
jgi:transcriptional regulator with XRE-family HTH domain